MPKSHKLRGLQVFLKKSHGPTYFLKFFENLQKTAVQKIYRGVCKVIFQTVLYKKYTHKF